MNTQTASQILAARTAFTGTDAEFIAAANTVPEPTWREAWVTANTIRANAAMGGPAVATAIYSAMVGAGIPDQAATFASVGFDMGTLAARAGVDAMRQAGVITAEQAAAIIAPARVEGQSQAQAWGLEQFTEVDLAEAARITAITSAIERIQNAAGYLVNEVLTPLIESAEAVPSVSNLADLFEGRIQE